MHACLNDCCMLLCQQTSIVSCVVNRWRWWKQCEAGHSVGICNWREGVTGCRFSATANTGVSPPSHGWQPVILPQIEHMCMRDACSNAAQNLLRISGCHEHWHSLCSGFRLWVRLKKYIAVSGNLDQKSRVGRSGFFLLTMVLKYANLVHTFLSLLSSSYILLCRSWQLW